MEQVIVKQGYSYVDVRGKVLPSGTVISRDVKVDPKQAWKLQRVVEKQEQALVPPVTKQVQYNKLLEGLPQRKGK